MLKKESLNPTSSSAQKQDGGGPEGDHFGARDHQRISLSPADRPLLTPHRSHHGGSTAKLAWAALGVVFGDIGTSPLYALRECFFGSTQHIEVNEQNVLGVLSLFFWSMTLVVTVKYILFVTRADNEGEGGILALLALALPKQQRDRLETQWIVVLGLFGASLLYADGMLTPAISVLSAIEGLHGIEVLDGFLNQQTVIFISALILVALFFFQGRGTARIGAAFAPMMAVWFVSIALFGAVHIFRFPSVLRAVLPSYAVQFFLRHGKEAFTILGSVVLCITGGEALYADMGHFGRKPIAIAWSFVFPALVLNYFGQGAFLLGRPQVEEESFFFALAGDWVLLRIYAIVIATFATVIASQALISGAFSLTRQAIQLGYLPRLEIRHTSGSTEGQIYMPEINWILMICCLALVFAFGSSGAMAAAYGIAVTGTMAITTVLFFLVTERWWGTFRAGVICATMLTIDLAFFFANFNKLTSGGWLPLVVASGILGIMRTWKKGRDRLAQYLKEHSEPLAQFLDEIDAIRPVRVKGTAVFMTSSLDGVPPVLLHHFKHNQVLHERVVLLSIVTKDVPKVKPKQRVEVEKLRDGFFKVIAHYGFTQTPNVMDALSKCEPYGIKATVDSTSFYLGRERLVIADNKAGMSKIQKMIFSFLSRNARSATDFFQIPPNRVVELGMQIEI
ncbi:MAG: potassium transporter Kup [Sandaracinaceae bacterium]|nr:potassium transporter Kup [Sandaracinaceae bacterium]